MRKIRSIGDYVICKLTGREKLDMLMTSDFVLVTKEQMEYPSALRDIEFDADTEQELIDFVCHEEKDEIVLNSFMKKDLDSFKKKCMEYFSDGKELSYNTLILYAISIAEDRLNSLK